MSQTPTKVLVVGAGPCGLTACKALLEQEVDFDCLEASDRLGGIWNIEQNGNGYRSLRTNTSKSAMAFSDFPFASGAPVHPNAEQMVSYFRGYAEHFELLQHISFNTSVNHIRRTDSGHWRISLGDGSVRFYAAVIIATGRYAKPLLPSDLDLNSFAGRYFHSSEYFDPQTPYKLAGQTVVVVGLGSSAVEIASELATANKAHGSHGKVIVSTRSGRWVLPKFVNEKPIDANVPHPSTPLPKWLNRLPTRVSRWLMRRLLGVMFRQQFKLVQNSLTHKLPTPKIPPWADRPTLSSDFLPLLESGDIELRPGIKQLAGKRVSFTDGSSHEADTVIFATGYAAEIPCLADSVNLGAEGQLRLYQHILHPEYDNLFFVGFSPVLCAMWPLAEQQSVWIAKLLGGKFKTPGPEIRHRQAIDLNHSLPLICGLYIKQLRKQSR